MAARGSQCQSAMSYRRSTFDTGIFWGKASAVHVDKHAGRFLFKETFAPGLRAWKSEDTRDGWIVEAMMRTRIFKE